MSRCYDKEDYKMDSHQLQAKYSDSPQGHPEFNLSAWQAGPMEVSYWDWVVTMIQVDAKAEAIVVGDDAIAETITTTDATVTSGNSSDVSSVSAPVVEEPAETNEEEVVSFGTIDALANVVSTWHKAGVNDLRHMLTVPEGTSVEQSTDDGGVEVFELTGDAHKAFCIGVRAALHLLGSLPFVCVTEDVPAVVEPVVPVDAQG